MDIRIKSVIESATTKQLRDARLIATPDDEVAWKLFLETTITAAYSMFGADMPCEVATNVAWADILRTGTGPTFTLRKTAPRPNPSRTHPFALSARITKPGATTVNMYIPLPDTPAVMFGAGAGAAAGAGGTAATARVCKACGATGTPMKRCTGCNACWYCSKECQVEDWRAHRPVCKATVT